MIAAAFVWDRSVSVTDCSAFLHLTFAFERKKWLSLKSIVFFTPVPLLSIRFSGLALLIRIPAGCTNARRCRSGEGAEEYARIIVDGAIMPRSYSPPAMARRANNGSSGGQSSIILRASERERCSARWRGHPSTPAVLQPSSSRPEPPVSLHLAWCHQVSPSVRKINLAEYKYLVGCR